MASIYRDMPPDMSVLMSYPVYDDALYLYTTLTSVKFFFCIMITTMYVPYYDFVNSS